MGCMQSRFKCCAAAASASPVPRKPRLVIAGATGVLGNEVLRRLVGLAAVRNRPGAGARAHHGRAARRGTRRGAPGRSAASGRRRPPIIGVVLFDPPRLFYDRERALWTPAPEQLLGVARWMRAQRGRAPWRSCCRMPRAAARSLKRGLADLDEQAVAALGFERLLIVRSAQKPAPRAGAGAACRRLAHWMLSDLQVHGAQQRTAGAGRQGGQFVAAGLQLAPPGIHIAAPETGLARGQGDLQAAVRQWLQR